MNMSGTESKPGDDVDGLLDKLAERVVGLRMTVPAILFLESSKPLNFVGSQMIGTFEPLVRTIFNWSDVERLRVALEDRGTIERLIVKIEDREARRADAAKKEKS